MSASNPTQLQSVDPMAKEILFRKHWSSTGWTKGNISAAEFSYAKSAGLMFDPVVLKHEAVLTRALQIRKRIAPQEIGNCFLASLSSRRLDWRSALGSYSSVLHLPSHAYTSHEGSKSCIICGLYPSDCPEDINIFNFERLKWGGVRHIQPHYAVLDLEWLMINPLPMPTESDVQIMRDVIDRIGRLPATARPGDIEKAMKNPFPANGSERRTLIGILGLAGVLAPLGFPSFRLSYPQWAARLYPDRNNDWAYPVWAWRGTDGIDRDALRFWFPSL